ncbi:hypothetical protein DFH09DRAFT_988706 [Mycena vulgaris]|nr:hypothetical protein DFH09DRAFT_988706 [Mycena vulgaris]
MHRCLTILEIIELVCGHVEVRYLGRDSPDLAALARTCKAFQDPALDLLWREQSTLTHMLKCLPSNVWEEKIHSRGPPSHFRLIGPIDPADWEIPLSYARRIRTLSLDVGVGYVEPTFLDAAILDTISSSLPQELLCPNLRSISWGPKLDPVFSNILLFLGPNITTVHLSLPAPSISLIASLSTLPLRYPELKTLHISWDNWDSFPLCPISSIIALDLDQIEILSLDGLDRAALQHLSHLPYLHSLTLHAPEVVHLGSSPSLSMGPFPALRSVTFLTTTFEFAAKFVDLLSDCRLEAFTVRTKVLATKMDTRQLYSSLASRMSHSALQSLTVQVVDYDSPTPPPEMIADYAISGNTLAPLFRFWNLTRIVLRTPVGFGIDDTTAWDIARAWPNLQSLTLDAASELHHTPTMTLAGLRAFATHCKVLSDLNISFDASTVPPFDNSPGTRISQLQLRFLGVAASPISEPPAVARFISGLFPRLMTISTVREWRWDFYTGFDDDDEMAAARAHNIVWKQIQAMLPMITAVRLEEREWARGSDE